ncbi:MAG: ABC transporter substrate-binding protein [Alicyclobacillus sp.]|nr:ABC transporter substrate-binding protein [Alicyclobacillus sp.]
MSKKRTFCWAVVALASVATAAGGIAAAGGGNAARPAAGAPVAGVAAGGVAAARTVSSFPITLTDDTGHRVTVAAQPHRIASVTEGTDEILSALVPKRDVVLVTTAASDPRYSNVIAWAKGIPAIAQADAERILAAKPDLVLLASYTMPGVVNQVEQAGVPAYEFADFNSIGDIERNILVVGKLVGEVDKARDVVAKMQLELARLSAAARGQKKLKVLDYSSYGYAAGSHTTVADIIARAGAVNAAAKLSGWQKVTDEEIVKMNPDVIIDSSDDKGFVKTLLSDPALQTVNAIRHHRVYLLKGADLSSVSQYVVNAVRDLEHVLYPKLKLPS